MPGVGVREPWLSWEGLGTARAPAHSSTAPPPPLLCEALPDLRTESLATSH